MTRCFVIIILENICFIKQITPSWTLTHCGRVMQYGDGSMLCKNPIFSLWKNSLKFKMLWFFESCTFLHFDSSWGGGGGVVGGVTLTKKVEKNPLFQRLWGENGRNHVHSIENKIWVKIKLKRDTGLHKKNWVELDLSCNLGQNSCLVFFNCLA